MGQEVLTEVAGICYRVATEGDTEAVEQLISNEFFVHLPLYKHLDFRVDPQFIKDVVSPAMASGVSIVAEKVDTRELVGACVNSIFKAKAKDNLYFVKDNDDNNNDMYRRHNQFMTMVDKLEAAVDYFQLYNEDEAVACRMLSVRQAYGKRGIGKRLQQLTIELTKKRNIRLVFGTTENLYSEKIYEAVGFKAPHRLRFKDYVDPSSGEKPFVDMESTELKVATLFALHLAD